MKNMSTSLTSKLSSVFAFSTLAACAALVSAASAHAQTDELIPTAVEATYAPSKALHFGAARQWFLSAEAFKTPLGRYSGTTGDLSLSWSSQAGSDSAFNIDLRPVAGYFFTDLIYGRLGFDIAFNNAESIDSTAVGIAPGVGVAWHVARRLSFAPWIGVDFLYQHATQDQNTGNYYTLDLEVHAPIVFDVVEHFSLTGGIYFAQDLVNHSNVTGTSNNLRKIGTVGFTAGLLGYW